MITDYKNRFESIESTENVKILGGFNIGSRSWGYDVENSDHDLRFVYVRDMFDYVKYDASEKQISYPISENYDILGWDLYKFLSLISKSNMIACEALFSQTIIGNEEFLNEIRNYVQKYFVSEKYILQYLNILKNQLVDIRKQDQIQIKTALFCLRIVCMMSYIHEFNQFPQCNLDCLFESTENKKIEAIFKKLIEMRKNGNEYLDDYKPFIKYVDGKYNEYNKKSNYSIEEKSDITELNSLLYKGIMLYNTDKKTL